jgi:DNA polymerase III subunit epsilon
MAATVPCGPVRSLQLTRPLAFFDLETTGTDPATDRIVEIAVLRLDPDGGREARARRLNPERPIPPDATAVHGIADADVAEAPAFRQIAKGLLDFLGEADLAGFNVSRFDVPLLDREFRDCGMDLGLDRRRIVDVMTIFHRKEPRHLSAAVRFYLGREHADAHSAASDVEAAADVLAAQLLRYEDLPCTIEALDGWIAPVPQDAVDRYGKFVLREGEVTFAFGRNRGKPLRDVAESDPDYLNWLLTCDFAPDARSLIEGALRGELPRC